MISIHAPRVGSDKYPSVLSYERFYFNPRSPCGERPNPAAVCTARNTGFQSTLPVWGATGCSHLLRRYRSFQSTLPVWGATPVRQGQNHTHVFQSTLPVWGATVSLQSCCRIPPISIHAPRVGSDFIKGGCQQFQLNFNPRSPCGERRLAASIRKAGWKFQSTLPVWGATRGCRSPCGERPPYNCWPCRSRPRGCRSPCGERPGEIPPFFQKNIDAGLSLPVWGATVKKRIFYSNFQFFSV